MHDVPPKIVKLALEHCGPTSFEKYAQMIFGSVIGHTFRPLGGVDSDILEGVTKATVFFQASMEVDIAGKIRKTVKRLKATALPVLFFTPRPGRSPTYTGCRSISLKNSIRTCVFMTVRSSSSTQTTMTT